MAETPLSPILLHTLPHIDMVSLCGLSSCKCHAAIQIASFIYCVEMVVHVSTEVMSSYRSAEKDDIILLVASVHHHSCLWDLVTLGNLVTRAHKGIANCLPEFSRKLHSQV